MKLSLMLSSLLVLTVIIFLQSRLYAQVHIKDTVNITSQNGKGNLPFYFIPGNGHVLYYHFELDHPAMPVNEEPLFQNDSTKQFCVNGYGWEHNYTNEDSTPGIYTDTFPAYAGSWTFIFHLLTYGTNDNFEHLTASVRIDDGPDSIIYSGAVDGSIIYESDPGSNSRYALYYTTPFFAGYTLGFRKTITYGNAAQGDLEGIKNNCDDVNQWYPQPVTVSITQGSQYVSFHNANGDSLGTTATFTPGDNCSLTLWADGQVPGEAGATVLLSSQSGEISRTDTITIMPPTSCVNFTVSPSVISPGDTATITISDAGFFTPYFVGFANDNDSNYGRLVIPDNSIPSEGGPEQPTTQNFVSCVESSIMFIANDSIPPDGHEIKFIALKWDSTSFCWTCVGNLAGAKRHDKNISNRGNKYSKYKVLSLINKRRKAIKDEGNTCTDEQEGVLINCSPPNYGDACGASLPLPPEFQAYPHLPGWNNQYGNCNISPQENGYFLPLYSFEPLNINICSNQGDCAWDIIFNDHVIVDDLIAFCNIDTNSDVVIKSIFDVNRIENKSAARDEFLNQENRYPTIASNYIIKEQIRLHEDLHEQAYLNYLYLAIHSQFYKSPMKPLPFSIHFSDASNFEEALQKATNEAKDNIITTIAYALTLRDKDLGVGTNEENSLTLAAEIAINSSSTMHLLILKYISALGPFNGTSFH